MHSLRREDLIINMKYEKVVKITKLCCYFKSEIYPSTKWFTMPSTLHYVLLSCGYPSEFGAKIISFFSNQPINSLVNSKNKTSTSGGAFQWTTKKLTVFAYGLNTTKNKMKNEKWFSQNIICKKEVFF